MRFFIVTVPSIASLVACGSGVIKPSTGVDPKNFYYSFSESFDENKPSVQLIASFKDQGPRGDSLELVAPNKITLEHVEMKKIDSRDLTLPGLILPLPFLALSLQGIIYSAHEEATTPKPNYTFNFTSADGSVRDFTIESAPKVVMLNVASHAQFSKQNGIDVETDVNDLDADSVLYLLLSSPADAKNHKVALTRCEHTDKVRCRFATSDLQNFPVGDAQLNLKFARTQRFADINGFKSSEYISKKITVRISE